MRCQSLTGFLHFVPAPTRARAFTLSKSTAAVVRVRPSLAMTTSSSSVPSPSSAHTESSCVAHHANVSTAPEGPVGLSHLTFEDSFVRKLPADSEKMNFVRRVQNAAYSFVEPTDPRKDDQREVWRNSLEKGEASSDPSPLSKDLVAWSRGAAELLDLNSDILPTGQEKNSVVDVLGGFGHLWPGMRCYAACYAGHQFGSFAGQLGDGRAITLGEYINKNGERWELQLKGAGKTPYSRHADGRAVLRSSVREFLASEAMFHLGVPTTRALCLVSTGAGVIRDMFYTGDPKLENGAVLTRMAPSLLRIGNFELPASLGNHDLLKQLADYAIKYHFPELESFSDDVTSTDRNRYGAFITEVARRNAEMVALWQGVGFVHGVLNTDNTSILGLTIDYGPYGFLDGFSRSYTPNTTDIPGGRYRYEMQPRMIKWNIFKLASALVPLCGLADAQRAAESFDAAYEQAHKRLFAKKLGVSCFTDQDAILLDDLFNLMEASSVDFTNTWRSLSNVLASSTSDDLVAVFAPLIAAKTNADPEKWASWMSKYRARIREDKDMDDAERVRLMQNVNPVYVLRNYMAQEAIDAADNGDFSLINNLYELLRSPYESQEGAARYTEEPPAWASKPGVCVNSCSS